MLKYGILICLLLMFSAACTSTATESQPTESEEMHEDEHNKEEHDEDEHDEDDHSDDTHSEAEHEGEHEDEDDHEADEDHREHGAHEHGAAELLIAWSGNELAIDLETPAYNVLGFEYAPTSDDEQALLEESVAILETGELIQFSPDANCTVTSASVETELAEEAHEDEEEHDEEEHEDDEVHSDIHVSYNIQCQQPDNLETLDVSALFTRFPNFEDLRAQWVSDAQQSAKDLTPDDFVLSFE